MNRKKRAKRYLCCQCLEDILPDEEAILIWDNKDDPRFVHAKSCWDKYKPFLFSFEVRKDGAIVGMCSICLKPIRKKQWYCLDRMIDYNRERDQGEEKYILETVFPNDKDKVGLVHDKCIEEVVDWGDFNQMMQDGERNCDVDIQE